MALVDRIKNILLTPKTEWDVIAAETPSTLDLFKRYVAPLAAIPAIAGFIGGSLIGYGGFGYSFKVPILAGLSGAILGYLMTFVSVFVIAWIINALAPTFNAEKSDAQALKLTVYALTASWLGGVFTMIPGLRLLGFVCALYSIYLLYLGLPRLMKCPEDKTVGYTFITVIAAIVVSLIIGALIGLVGHVSGGPGMMGGMRTDHAGMRNGNDTRLGNLEDFSKKMEQANRQMEEAEKSGDKDAAAKAALSMMGTVLGAGKAAEPLDIATLKRFVPETFAGLPKKSASAEKSGALGIAASRAEARYGDSTELEIADTGGAAGWMSIASWATMQGEKEDETGTEKTMKVGNRLVHEVARKDGHNEYSVVLGERFVVTAKSSVLELSALKAAVGKLELDQLEAMKDVGVQK